MATPPSVILDQFEFEDIEGLASAYLDLNGAGNSGRVEQMDALDRELIQEAKAKAAASNPPPSP